MGADPLTEDAQHVLDWIIRTGTARFTKRELFSAMARGRFSKVADLEPVLDLLESHVHIHRQPEADGPTGRGRRPSPTYLVHPQYWSAESAQSAEMPSRPISADSADIAETSRPYDPKA
jgi:replicative DNA helicase